MPPTHTLPQLFYQLGRQSPVGRRPTPPDDAPCVARAAVVDAVRKGAYAAAMLLLEATPGLLDEVLNDRRCWGLFEHPPFAAAYPEAAEQMTTARALREGFEASLCR